MFELRSAASYPPLLLVLGCYFVLPEKRALVFNILAALMIIPSAWLVLDPPSAIRFSATFVGVSLFAYIAIHEINNLHGQLEDRILTDELTGLFNRSSLTSSIEQAIAQQQRSGIPMALIAFDVDHFKSINDTLGHPAGDAVLTGLGNLLRARSRKTDEAFRMSGGEFLVLVHNTDQDQAVKLRKIFAALSN
jgi:predicted signal transduction protein with EAL and GGDEF domain